MVLETMDELYRVWRIFFVVFEVISVSLFLFEYLLRVWVADLTPKYQHPIGGRIRYMLSPMALIEQSRNKDKVKICPHCGGKLDT